VISFPVQRRFGNSAELTLTEFRLHGPVRRQSDGECQDYADDDNEHYSHHGVSESRALRRVDRALQVDGVLGFTATIGLVHQISKLARPSEFVARRRPKIELDGDAGHDQDAGDKEQERSSQGSTQAAKV
jgi:hypothetical protein